MGSAGEVQATCSDDEFIRLVTTIGPTATARKLRINERSVFKRREKLEGIYGPIKSAGKHDPKPDFPDCHNITIKNGPVIIASDFHTKPGKPSVVLRALKKLCRELEPVGMIINGDLMDFPQISRWPVPGWSNQPTILEEIDAAKEHTFDIEQAVKRGCHKIHTLGNHDWRFELRLAQVAPEFKGIQGTRLHDHFPTWERCWSVRINDDILVKHKPHKGGKYAPANSTLHAGMTTVHSHLHSPKVWPHTDFNGTRYGIDTGMVADPYDKPFDYLEQGVRDWRSAFAVLTFRDGHLMMPEHVVKWNDTHVQFRGLLVKA